MRFKESIQWIYRASKGVRSAIILYTLFGALSVGASLLFVYLTKSLIDLATRGGELSSIYRNIGMLVGTIALQQLLYILKVRVSKGAEAKLMNRLRLNLFESVMRSEWHGKESKHSGDVVNRIESDSRTISETICITIPAILVTLIHFLASFRFLQLLDTHLSWIIAAIMPIALLASKRYIFTMRKLTQAIRSTDSSVQSHLQEQIQNRTVINTIGDTTASIQRLQSWSATLFEQTMQRVNYTLFSRTTVQIGFALGYVTALTWGVLGLQSGAVTFGMLTAFLQLVNQIQRPSVELATQISSAAQSTASIDRLHEIDSLRSEEQSHPTIIEGEVGLSLQDVDFEYSDGEGRKILSKFNYNFSPNKLHVIVGKTGVGKSTLIRLMLGLLKVNSGSIELYNMDDKRAACSAATRANFIYVPQGNSLMSGTIRQNLLLAKPTATEQQIEKALYTAVAEFVLDLPLGLDTLCGERGAGLSEGEAQRIAIARGVLQSGSIILLDEPTSALDSKTEEVLISRLAEYAKDRTLIMVTHRDTAAQLCASVVKIK